MDRGVLLLVLSLTGVLAGDWSVSLPSDPVCSVTGSSVVLRCSYDYPQSSRETGGGGQLSAKGGEGGVKEEEYKVLSEMWCLGQSRCITPRYVFHSAGIFPDLSYQNRVEYLGQPGSKNCSLRISGLRLSDSGTYVFYLITSHPTQKMPEQRGVQLLVADRSKVAVSLSPCSDIMKGMALQLTCCSSGANPDARYSWYKDAITTPLHDGQVWSMSNVDTEDAGSYYCQVQTGDRVHNSTRITVDVQYPPKNTVVSVSPPGDIRQGVPVTLSCTSDANPPVDTYTWYQGIDTCSTIVMNDLDRATESLKRAKGTGQRLNITIMNVGEHEAYCCVASNRHGSKMHRIILSADTESIRSPAKGWSMVTVGAIIAAVAIIGIVAFVIWRKQRSASSHQSYALTETNTTAP